VGRGGGDERSVRHVGDGDSDKVGLRGVDRVVVEDGRVMDGSEKVSEAFRSGDEGGLAVKLDSGKFST
jgi:hypothetical protein